MQRFIKFFRHRKLRMDIAMIFISVLLLTSISIISYTYHHNSKAILKIAQQLMLQMDRTIVTNMDNYLRPPFFLHFSNQWLAQDKNLSPQRLATLQRGFLAAQDAYPQMNSVYLADPSGNFYLLSQITEPITQPYPVPIIGNHDIPSQTKYIWVTLRHHTGKTFISIQYQDKQHHTLKTEQTSQVHYNPLDRPWYQGAQTSADNYWFGVYQFFTTKELGLTAASPIFIHHRFAGIIAADFTMNGFVKTFRKIVMENKSSAFIFNKESDIIAYQGFNSQESLPINIVKINHLHNPIMQMVYSLYQKNHQSKFVFNLHGTRYIAYISSYASNSNENWKIATVVPLDMFIGEMKDTNYYTILFSSLMVFLGLLLAMFAADRISQPIMRIASNMNKMQQLNFSADKPLHSSIFEIQIIADALNSTKYALSSFAKYVPNTLVRQLLKNKSTAQLGGVKKPMTILFTDIANYTTTAENMDPDELIIHLSEYLNEMTSTIHQHAGNIDKYIGDAIMAFWNDPEEDSHHILHACQAILACQMKMKTLNNLWRQMGKPALITRFGLNTGDAIVGNMGSADRLNYTVIGDTVNLAARLEKLNKIYGTEIIVSEAVYRCCHQQMLFRPLDTVVVRGKQQATKIYELIAAKSVELSPRVATTEDITLCEWSTLGYEAFHQGDLTTAQIIFSNIQERFPRDPMAQFYLKKLDSLIAL